MSKGDLFGDSVYESGDPVDDTDGLDPIEGLTGDDPDEAMQTGYSPPEREPYNLRHMPTASEAHQGESLDERLAEEEPDISRVAQLALPALITTAPHRPLDTFR